MTSYPSEVSLQYVYDAWEVTSGSRYIETVALPGEQTTELLASKRAAFSTEWLLMLTTTAADAAKHASRHDVWCALLQQCHSMSVVSLYIRLFVLLHVCLSVYVLCLSIYLFLFACMSWQMSVSLFFLPVYALSPYLAFLIHSLMHSWCIPCSL